jgi:hypothetical protein
LDSLFLDVNSGSPNVWIDQTLDQDLADLTAGGGYFGIWQRLHQAFDRSGGEGAGSFTGIDQTVEAVLQEESGASSFGVTSSGVAPGIVVSYMGQWFQTGQDMQFGGNHTEWGGHGPVTSTPFDGSAGVAIHDP